MRWISSCLLVLTASSVLSSAYKWETLKKKIFKGYDPEVRPQCGGVNTVTNVTLGVALRQILKLNSPSQEITINVWMRLNWKDCRLVWNETEYGIPHVQLPVNRVWKPDITVYDSCCSYPFVDLTFYLHIRRRALHYVINLIFPCVLISALTQLGFMLPVESGEKVSLQITVMLSLAVFLLVISEHLPPSSESIPLVGAYFALTLVLVTVSCAITVVVVNIHFKSQRRVPGLIKRIFIQKLGKLLMVQQIGSRAVNKSNKPSPSSHRYMVDGVSTHNKIEMDRIIDNMGQHTELPGRMINQHDVTHSDIHSDIQKYVSTVSSRMEINRNNALYKHGSDIDHQISEHGACLHKIAGHFEEADAEDCLRLEWNILACVIDRLFFIICMTFLIVSTVTIFIKLDS